MKKIFLMFLLLWSCSKKDDYKQYHSESVNIEYFQALRDFDSRNYAISLKGFENISKQYSIYKIAKNSIQMEIFLQYLLQKYQEVIDLSEMYYRYYPVDKNGLEYVKMMEIKAREKIVQDYEVSAENAKNNLQQISLFIQQYPNSRYTNTINEIKKTSNLQIYLNLLNVANQYKNKNHYISALIRYKEALKYANNSQSQELQNKIKDCNEKIIK